jgi:hypothetical protein
MRIPFSTLRYGPRRSRLGAEPRPLHRSEERAGLLVAGSPAVQPLPAHGGRHPEGMSKPPPQRVTTFTPYLLGGAQQNLPGNRGPNIPSRWARTRRSGSRPSLALDLTVNTDFAQVEVDDQQVDLTRFNLFFPERAPSSWRTRTSSRVQSDRPGSSQTPVQMFHSRRIGVHGGQEVPIQAGARVSGRWPEPTWDSSTCAPTGSRGPGREWLDGGSSRPGAPEPLPGRGDLHPARVLRHLWRRLQPSLRRWTGASGSGTSGPSMLVGITDTPELEGDSQAHGLRGEYRSESTGSSRPTTTTSGTHFNPEVGFVRGSSAVGLHRPYHFRVMRFVRVPQVSWLRELRPHTSYTVSPTWAGFKLTERVHMHTHIEFESGASPCRPWTGSWRD